MCHVLDTIFERVENVIETLCIETTAVFQNSDASASSFNIMTSDRNNEQTFFTYQEYCLSILSAALFTIIYAKCLARSI